MNYNKRIGIFLGHPAHFHLFKNVAIKLSADGYHVDFLIKRKDVLEELLQNSGYQYIVVRKHERKASNKFALVISLLGMDFQIIRYIIRYHPSSIIGTYSPVLSHFCRIPFFIFNEDDSLVVPRFAKTSYPFAKEILTPSVCDCGKWNKKAIKYASYHELSYLHPLNFCPNNAIASKYVNTDKPYVLIRFVKLSAHHDSNIKGINFDMAMRIVTALDSKFTVYITSERPLSKDLEKYRLNIKPIDIHHVMAFASFYIGDSQTMAAESGILGVPFIRFNDFVGRIGYLRELENVYHLGWGIKTDNPKELENTVSYLSSMEDRSAIFAERKKIMLSEKIELSGFIAWFIEEYPRSKYILKENPDYQYRFK